MKEITDSQADFIIKNAGIPQEMLESAVNVAVVLTQDWCPQWITMKKWLKNLDDNDTEIFYLCYNKKKYSREFMQMKETVWKNSHVPYVRYYRNAELVNESNYAGQAAFKSNLSS